MKTTHTPFNIFQTHKSVEYINSKPILVNAINSWKNHKEFNHFIYNNKDCDNFIKNNFERKVYEAYSRLPMGVMKADLWRYCVIYKIGGIYADVDTICINNPKLFINDSLLTVAPENNVHLCNWTFSAPKQSPILKSVIDLSVERILSVPQIRGEHIIHYLTGPGVFTEGIELYLKKNNLPVYENKMDYTSYKNTTMKVFNHHNFHNSNIKHLYAGQDNDGWYFERHNKLMI